MKATDSSPSKIIVTGANGFIGKALVRDLVRHGYPVVGLIREDGDITSPKFWAQLPPATALIHLAALSFVPDSWDSPNDYFLTNTYSTQLALNWCRENSANFIFPSTYVYGTPEYLPIDEKHAVKPNNPYALSKHLAEQLCQFAAQHNDQNITILRLFNVFGPNQKQSFLIPTLLNQLHAEEIVVKDLSPKRDFIYLADVVRAFRHAIERTKGFNCLNIGSGVAHSVDQIIEELQRAAGSNLPVTQNGTKRKNEINEVVADISKAMRVLDWGPSFTIRSGFSHMLPSNK